MMFKAISIKRMNKQNSRSRMTKGMRSKIIKGSKLDGAPSGAFNSMSTRNMEKEVFDFGGRGRRRREKETKINSEIVIIGDIEKGTRRKGPSC